MRPKPLIPTCEVSVQVFDFDSEVRKSCWYGTLIAMFDFPDVMMIRWRCAIEEKQTHLDYMVVVVSVFGLVEKLLSERSFGGMKAGAFL